MKNSVVKASIIKIVGLLGDLPKKPKSNGQNDLLQAGFNIEKFPTKLNGERDEDSIKFLKDYFYTEFRDIMFFDSLNKRFFNKETYNVSLIKKVRDKNGIEQKINYDLSVKDTEVFLFPGNISLFSLTIKVETEQLSLETLNNVLFLIRNFDTETSKGLLWHEWISKYTLGGIDLRGPGIKADEYSGSKFKLYTVIDTDVSIESREHCLYDMATVSPIGSADGNTFLSPSESYYQKIMENKVEAFNNWEALCLFDSFTCLGNNQLANVYSVKTWEYTYFRIYVFRLFLKYNLFKYNSEIKDDSVKLRDEFENFLNNYNISTISFNFLGNMIYQKIGESLYINEELEAFQNRINRISQAIQEEKQGRTNNLLQLVSILGGITSLGPIYDILTEVKIFFSWSDIQFYTALSSVTILIGIGLFCYLMPDHRDKLMKKWKLKS
jgi:hypothetical protein